MRKGPYGFDILETREEALVAARQAQRQGRSHSPLLGRIIKDLEAGKDKYEPATQQS